MTSWLPLVPLVIAFVIYPAVAWLCLRVLRAPWRMRGLAACNLIGAATLCLVSGLHGVRMRQLGAYATVAILLFTFYLAGVIAQYVLLRWSEARGWRAAPAAFLLPVAFLVRT